MKKLTFWKSLFLLFALIVGTSTSWAEDVTIASFNAATYYGGTKNGWDVNSSASYGTGGGGYYQLFSGAVITTPSIDWSQYKNVKIVLRARTYSSPSNSQKVIAVKQGSTQLTSYSPGKSSLSNSSQLSISPTGTGSLTISCPNASTAKCSGVSDITITGEENSSDPSSGASFDNTTPSMDIKTDGFTYSQAVKTATGYNGTITYSLTTNTAGASIDTESGVVTVAKAGSVTVKANCAKVDGSWASSNASYTLTVNDTRATTVTSISTTGLTNTEIQNGLSAGQLTASVKIEDDDVDGATVTWTSSNPAIATIDNDGNVTLVKNGTTTITAAYAGNEANKPSSATYDLTVTNSAVISINLNNTLFGISTGSNENEQNKTVNGVKITTGCTSSASSKTYYDTDHIRFYDKSYLELEAPSGYVIIEVALNRYSTGNWNPDKVSVWEDDNEEEGELTGDNPLLWSGQAAKLEFDYAGQCRTASVDVTLAELATITLNALCTDGEKIYGTYSNSKAFIVPEGLTVSAVSVDKGKLVVTDYAKGDIVKANTGVMVSATTAGEKTILLTSATGTEKSGNMLKGTGTGIDADAMAAAGGEGYKYYRLTMHGADPSNDILGTIGYFWGAAEGAAFGIAANKAYLAVPPSVQGEAKNFYLFGDDATTGIANLNVDANENFDVNAPMYNLAGQRVNKSYKGVVIVNGKKMLNK